MPQFTFQPKPTAPVETPGTPEREFAHSPAKRNPWKLAFRIVRWATYAAALISLAMVLHKAPPPPVETSPVAAARLEEKIQDVEKAVASGQPATLRMDETELNSYLAQRLGALSAYTQPALKPSPNSATSATGGNSTQVEGTPNAAPNANSGGASSGAEPTPAEIEDMKSNVRDIKVQLVEDRVRAYIVFDVHGKDMTLELEGHLSVENGYLKFVPTSGQIGAFPIPQSALETAMQRVMESPANREKLKLPAEISDLRIENGEVVTTYK